MELHNRQLSLDVLRGITVTLMIIVNTPGNGATTYGPLEHAAWHGFTPTDWVFPTFMFVVGNAMSFSLTKYEAMGTGAFLGKVSKRTLLIFLLGFLMYWFPFVRFNEAHEIVGAPFSQTRVMGVLQRIALGYFFASVVLYFWKERGAIIFSIFALFSYWILMVVFGDLTMEGNAGILLDKWVLGEGHMYHGEGITFDPEGILSTLPAIVNVIAGALVGRFIIRHGNNFETLTKLLIAGTLLFFASYVWDLSFPINKKLWTSSFVLHTVGIDLLVLSVIIYVIEIRKMRNWTYFFEVFGRNTLFIYLLSEIGLIFLFVPQVDGVSLYHWLYVNVFQHAGAYFGSFLFAVSWMLLCWSVGYLLDRKKVYVKV